jgi:glycerol transport system ATP-binding protein
MPSGISTVSRLTPPIAIISPPTAGARPEGGIMAKITLSQLRHSYAAVPSGPQDYALKEIDLDWQNGGAYALLGPSGCGKSTLLNIISGLLRPSEGRILFDDREVTNLPPDQRNIAQVFQFPVIYDTMTVYDNLAFPLRNRGVDEGRVKARVTEIAEMLEVTDLLRHRASGFGPDVKQKISMGRGLVRDDVNVVMFDEPLTVIDPHLKWKLRSKLKELHRRTGATMIYVTHDQTEALTFADQVVVMQDGEVVQIGTPVDLFERPAHTFVGHFIGSPGMNILPCEVRDGGAFLGGAPVALDGAITGSGGRTEIGVRPESVSLAPQGLPARVSKVQDIGRHLVVEAMVGDLAVKAITDGPPPEQGAQVHLALDPARTRLYRDGWISTTGGRA